MSKPPQGPLQPLYKQQSWSPDILRDEAWQRRKGNHVADCRHRPSRSLSEDDLEELKACIELGFGFDLPEIDPKLSNTIPALEFYHAVHKQYNRSLSRSSSTSSLVSDSDTGSGSHPSTIFDPGDDLAAKKTRLKQWAQVVACAVRQSYPADHNNGYVMQCTRNLIKMCSSLLRDEIGLARVTVVVGEPFQDRIYIYIFDIFLFTNFILNTFSELNNHQR